MPRPAELALSILGTFGHVILIISPVVIAGTIIVLLVVLQRKRRLQAHRNPLPTPAPAATSEHGPSPVAPASGPPPSAHQSAPAADPLSDTLLKAAILAPTVSMPGTGTRRKPPPMVEDLQAAFPDLQIIALIGQGGMGAVYRVKRIADGAILALKVVDSTGEQSDVFIPRFLREAEVLHKLNHPNIVAIRSHGRSGQWCWLLMDLVEGSNLRQVVSTGALSPNQALALVGPLCSALQYAHDQGVVHRDIKPENILIDVQGHPFLVDFGLAKLRTVQTGESLTVSGAVLGTLHYMAPEQIERSRSVDHRADIYALGVVIYELLTGRLPLGRFEPPSHAVNIDVRIDEVVLRALERNPERRWQQASQVQQAMQGISDHAASPEGVPHQAPASSPASVASKVWGMDVNTFTIAQHLAGLIPVIGVILIFVMWITCRHRHQDIDRNGRNIIDWVISSWLYCVIAGFLTVILIGIPILFAISIAAMAFAIIGAAKASHGVAWRYPCSLRIMATADQAGKSRGAFIILGSLLGLLLIGAPILLALGFLFPAQWSRASSDQSASILLSSTPEAVVKDIWGRQKKTLELPSFTRIRVEGIEVLRIAVGRPQSVTLLGADFVLSNMVKARVEDDTLLVRKSETMTPFPDELIITVPTLSDVEFVSTQSSYTSPFDANSDQGLLLEIVGSGDIHVSGSASQGDFKISGSGNIDAKDFHADEVAVHIPGNGHVAVAKSVSLDANITGAGSISYAGNPDMHKNLSSHGQLIKRPSNGNSH